MFMAAMRRNSAFHVLFNVENMGRMIMCGYSPVAIGSARERQAMMKTKNVVAALRRDVSFIGNAVVAVIFICFASLAVAAALLDLLAFRH
jgi:hypothetical protein